MKKWALSIIMLLVFGQINAQESVKINSSVEPSVVIAGDLINAPSNKQTFSKKQSQKKAPLSKAEMLRKRRNKIFYLACIATGTIVGGIALTFWYFKKKLAQNGPNNQPLNAPNHQPGDAPNNQPEKMKLLNYKNAPFTWKSLLPGGDYLF